MQVREGDYWAPPYSPKLFTERVGDVELGKLYYHTSGWWIIPTGINSNGFIGELSLPANGTLSVWERGESALSNLRSMPALLQEIISCNE